MDSAITNLVSRLEQVTARLESVEKQLATGGGSVSSSSSHSSSHSSVSENSQIVEEYQLLIDGDHFKKFVELSAKINFPQVGKSVNLAVKAINAQRDMIKIAANCKKPSADNLTKIFKPTNDIIDEIHHPFVTTDKKEQYHKGNEFFNHVSAVSSGMASLRWVLAANKPADIVTAQLDESEFFINKILMQYKSTDKVHVEWITNLKQFLQELRTYIENNHKAGLTWNAKGGDALNAPTAGPPPPNQPPIYKEEAVPAKKANLFAELNKGGDVTVGLKKVTSDMKNKNRTDISSLVPANAIKTKETTSSSAKTAVVKPPKFLLEGMKWCVENQINNKEIVISDTEAKQTCYIYKCKGSVIQVKGKINAIVMDSCEKTAVVFENLVSTCDVVNCTSVEVQVTGKVPSISIDKTSGCQIYISKEALQTEIYTSKSSEMNVLIPPKNEDDDLIEIAIPEQYRTTIKDFKLITECTSHV